MEGLVGGIEWVGGGWRTEQLGNRAWWGCLGAVEGWNGGVVRERRWGRGCLGSIGMGGGR